MYFWWKITMIKYDLQLCRILFYCPHEQCVYVYTCFIILFWPSGKYYMKSGVLHTYFLEICLNNTWHSWTEDYLEIPIPICLHSPKMSFSIYSREKMNCLLKQLQITLNKAYSNCFRKKIQNHLVKKQKGNRPELMYNEGNGNY